MQKDLCLGEPSTSQPLQASVYKPATSTSQYRASLSKETDMPSAVPTNTGRRTTLPAHCTDNSHIGIMNILYNNIGKDLSRISMPVALNEPLCLLQRVSEELEYSELLDIANRTDDPFERMVSGPKRCLKLTCVCFLWQIGRAHV